MNLKLYPLKVSKLYTHGGGLNGGKSREWCAEKISNKKNLLICIGDSWTWGDCLGKTSLEFNDKNARYDQFYTNKLAEKLDSDWLMVAWCGESNDWILKQYQIITNAIKNNFYKNYKKIYVHICFTELFREINIIPLDSNNFLYYKNCKNFLQFCNDYFNISILNKINQIETDATLHKFSMNFWNIDQNILPNSFVKEYWQNLLFKKSNIEELSVLPVVSGLGIWPLLEFLKKNKLKDITYSFSKTLPIILNRLDKMQLCILNNKVRTKHPTAEGHTIWTEYLYDVYKNL